MSRLPSMTTLIRKPYVAGAVVIGLQRTRLSALGWPPFGLQVAFLLAGAFGMRFIGFIGFRVDGV